MGSRHEQLIGSAGLDRERLMLIGGQLLPAEARAALPTLDPTTGRALAEIPAASAADVDAAVAAARSAFEAGEWRRNVALRKRTLLALSRLAERDQQQFATIDTLDVGMIAFVSQRFGSRALVRNLEYFATWADKIYGDVVPVPSGHVFDFTRREPYGVVAAIYAWNTPSLFLGSKLGPALAAGNTVVVKPSELGSLSALHLAELCEEAEVPPGVINIVTGAAKTGHSLVAHAGVDKISFTGGTATGRAVQRAAAETLTPAHLELGGKSPHIVMADSDLDKALAGVVAGAFAFSGQACAAGTRALVEASIYDRFVEQLGEAAKALAVGDPAEPATFIGPLISEQHRQRVLGYIETGRDEGARLVSGGHPLGEAGYFVEPTVFADVEPAMTIAREEIFGPVLSVMRFERFDEALRIANDTVYGLAAGIWTRDVGRALEFAEEVQAGNVWINGYGNIPHTAPFGGYRRSGIGREGGHEAILEYTQVKNVAIDLGVR